LNLTGGNSTVNKVSLKLFIVVVSLLLVFLTPVCGRTDETYRQALDKLEAGKLQKALSLLDGVTEKRPDFAEAWNNKGSIYLTTGNYPEAKRSFEKALQIKPEYPKARANLGTAYLKQGETEKAITAFKGALEIDPENEEANYNLGNVYIKQGNLLTTTEVYP
jgi:tetratricopeptide (TPR) repeat protein